MTRAPFRAEAVAAQGSRLPTEIPADGLGAAAGQVALMLAVLVAVVLTLVLAPLPRSVEMWGVVAAWPAPIRVVLPETGVVVRVHVRTGDLVGAGDPVLTLERPAGIDTPQAVLQDQIDSLTAVRALGADEAATRAASLQRQAEGILERQRGIEAILQQGRDAVALAEAEVDRLAALQAQGLALTAEVAAARKDHLDATIAVMTYGAELLAVKAEGARLADEAALADAAQRRADAALAGELAEARSNLAAQATPTSRAIVAPVGGRVDFVQARVGETLNEGAMAMVIGQPVQSWGATLYLTARQAAALRGTTALQVWLTTSDGRSIPATATLTALSVTPVPADAVTITLPHPAGTPVYRADLAIPDTEARRAGLVAGQSLRIVARLPSQRLMARPGRA